MRLASLLTVVAAFSIAASSLAQQDPGWPRVKSGPNGKLTMYLPQVDAWDYKTLKARMAVVAEPTGGKPQPGALEFQADTVVDSNSRTVGLTNLKVNAARFPDAEGGLGDKVSSLINQEVAGKSLSVSLDRMLAMIGKEEFSGRSVAVKNDPPKILVSKQPAVLVMLDGDPIMQKVPGTGLLYAVNTNWDMLLDTTASQVYLLNKDTWLTTTDPKNPDWKPVSGALPGEFNRITDDGNWREVRKHIPAKPATGPAPKVYVTGVPTELILFEGEPQMMPIPGTRLMFMSNTESDLVFSTADSAFYYLVSGRWFKASSLEGPWTAAGSNLPEDFSRIPPDHSMARLLASVPGTSAAQDAVMLATVPTFGTANREMTTLTVTYDGTPLFKAIDGSPVKYATNTSFNVLQLAGNYYCCYEAVWFVSASPNGPWAVCDTVPKEIYAIPASSPMYPVTYVQVYEKTPETVTYGYTKGYEDSYISDGRVVYGTGYNYQPYVSNAVVWGLGLAASYAVNSQIIDNWSDFWNDHPQYYYGWRPPYYAPYGYSYGAAAYYNPYNGTWGRGAYAYGPYGGVAGRSVYNPYTGTYARGYAAHGPYQSGFGMQAYNPRTGTYAATRQGSNPYANWGSSVVRNGDDWLRTAHYNDTRAFRTSEGARGVSGDDRGIVTDSDGNRYIKGDDGWSKWEGNQWRPSNRPEPYSGVNRGGQQFARTQNLAEGRIAPNAKNNMFVGNDGAVYRQNGNDWQKYDKGGNWQNSAKVENLLSQGAATVGDRTGQATGNRAQAGTAATLPARSDLAANPTANNLPANLNRDAQARTQGAQNTQRYQQMQPRTAAPRTQSVQRSTYSAPQSRSTYSAPRSNPSPSRPSGGSRSSGGGGGGRGGRR